MLLTCLAILAQLDTKLPEMFGDIQEFRSEYCWYKRTSPTEKTITAKAHVSTDDGDGVAYLRAIVTSQCKLRDVKMWSVPQLKSLDTKAPLVIFKLKKDWLKLVEQQPDVCQF